MDLSRLFVRLPVAALALGLAVSANAQTTAPPSGKPAVVAPANPAPKPTKAQAKTERDLTLAAFANRDVAPPPGGPAAKVAAESAKEKMQAPPEPRPEWKVEPAVSVTGDGVQVKSPF